jgi:hypothetical protein
VVVTQPQLAGRADHAVADPPVGLARGDREPAGQHRAGQRDDHEVALEEVGGAADDPAHPGLGLRDLVRLGDLDHAVPDGLLVLGELLDLRDPADHERAAHLPERGDLLDLDADPDERVRELFRGESLVGLEMLGEPADGNPHGVWSFR